MAVTFVKTDVPVVKEKKVSSVVGEQQHPVEAELNSLGAEYLQIELKLKALEVKKMQDRQAEIKKALNSIVADEVADTDSVTINTPYGDMNISARAQGTEIVNMKDLLDFATGKVGWEAVSGVVTLTLGNLTKILSENEYAPYVKSVMGSRRITSTLKG